MKAHQSLLALALIGCTLSANAQTTIEISPTRDNTLYEDPDGSLSNGRGSHLFVGRIQTGEVRRALVAFDDLSAIPEDASILGVEVELTMNRTIVGPVRIDAHAVLADWGEGASDASNQEGAGGAAAPGDATWIHRFFNTDRWDTVGGDFEPTSLATAAVVDQAGAYRWSSEALARRVEAWRTGEIANHGLVLLGEVTTGTTAKRFGAREGDASPILRVTYQEANDAPPLVRLSGLWADPELLGEGFNIIESSAGITVYYFGYDASGERLWLISETLDVQASVDQTLDFTVFLGAGGTFDAPRAGPPIEWGRLELTPLSCTQARFELMGDEGMKVSDADLLASIAGVDCNPGATN